MPVPIDELIAYSEGRLDDRDVSRFLRAYERDCGRLSWVGERAEAFDEVDRDGARQIGLTHAFLAPGPWATPAVERRFFAEVRWLVAWLRRSQASLDWCLRFATTTVISVGYAGASPTTRSAKG